MSNKTNTNKYSTQDRLMLIIIFVIFLFLLYGIIKWLGPSNVMKEMRDIENEIASIEPDYREENDTGYNNDWKTGESYHRYIVIGYSKKSDYEKILENLPRKGWNNISITKYEDGEYARYTNQNYYICITASNSSSWRFPKPNYWISIDHDIDNKCS